MARICWARSTGCFIYKLLIQVISEKTLVAKILLAIWELALHENNRNYISFRLNYKFTFILFLSCLTNQNQESGFQQVGSLVTRYISNFAYSESRSNSKPCWIQQTFLKDFNRLLYYIILYYIILHCVILYCTVLYYIILHPGLPKDTIVRLSHSRSGDRQDQETFLAPSGDKQIRNYDI